MRFDKKSSLKSDKKAPPKPPRKGIASYNRKTALLEEAITHMNAGKYGRSSAALKELLALDPLNTEARRLFATLHLRLGSLISARTAFESLAREALERQDFWLAESLLREYLTAGPRCVPFLVMLGQLYEEKGDAMSAVAEYGKAIEVLVEDPDPDNPNRGAELFGKIRTLAPHSSVVSRIAALLDPTTGQLRGVPPQPTEATAAEEGSQSSAPGSDAEEGRVPPTDLRDSSDSRAFPDPSLPEEEIPVSPVFDRAESPMPGSPEALQPSPDETEDLPLLSASTESPGQEQADEPLKFLDDTAGFRRPSLSVTPPASRSAVQEAVAFSYQEQKPDPEPIPSPSSAAVSMTGPLSAIRLMDNEQGPDCSTKSPADQAAAVFRTAPGDDMPPTSSPLSLNKLPTLSWEEVLKAVQGHKSEQAAPPSSDPLLEVSDRGDVSTPFRERISEPLTSSPSMAALQTDDSLSGSSYGSLSMPWEQIDEVEPESIANSGPAERYVAEDRSVLVEGDEDRVRDHQAGERPADEPEFDEALSGVPSELPESHRPIMKAQAGELSPALRPAESAEMPMEATSACGAVDDAEPRAWTATEDSIEPLPETVESVQAQLSLEAERAVHDEAVSPAERQDAGPAQACEEPPEALVHSDHPSPELAPQLEESAAVSDSVDRPIPVQSEAMNPTADQITILWDPSTSQSASDHAGLGLIKRWLRRSAPDEPPISLEAQASAGGASAPAAPNVTTPSSATPSPLDMLLGTQGTLALPQSEPKSAKRKPQEPPYVRLWKRLKWDVRFICRRCFSTTRSITLSLLSLVLAVVLVVAICVGTTGLAWLVMEQQPSPAYRALTALPERTLKDASTNGYLMLLGFDAGPNQDPMQATLGRKPDKTDLAKTQACLSRVEERNGAFQGGGDRMLGTWHRDGDPAARFGAQSGRIKAWVEQADRWVGRYQQWLTMPFEDWGYGESISPNCQVILRTHRLYVAEGFTKDVTAGMARLETDLTRWRQVMGGARSLPLKMLAADAITDDVAIMSGLLAHPDLDDQLLARLMKLARPLDEAESSLRWPMQSELARGTAVQEMLLNQDATDQRPLYASLASRLPLPKQRRLNDYADYYEALSQVGGDKLFASLPKRSAFVRYPAAGWIDYGLNPIENLVGVPPLPAWDTYSGRILSLDAQLRLSGLQAWIGRSRRDQDVLTRIAKAGQALYDPFTGFPMLINRRSGRIYSVGEDGQDNDGQAGRDISAVIPLSTRALQDAARQPSASKSRS